MRRLSSLAGIVLALAAPACAQESVPDAAGTTARGGISRDSVVSLANAARAKGADAAPVTIIEISDFQCPYCAQFATETFPKIDSAYVKTGKVKFVFLNLPLPMHAEAWPAAEAALCAGAQGAFWPMHDRIFATQREWSGKPDAPARFAQMAAQLRLDMPAYRECLEGDYVAQILTSDVMQAAQAGLTGTPSFIFDGREAASGALPFEEFQKRIEPLLAGAPAAPTPRP